MNSGNEAYVNGLRRAEENIELTAYLGVLGIAIQPYTFVSSGENVLIERIKIKGSRSKRKMAYSKANEASKTVGEFPGGIELDVVEVSEDGKWIIAKLPNGEKGYFKDKDLIRGK